MTWAVLALLTAFFESGKDVLGKRLLSTLDPVVVAFGWRAFALPFLLPVLWLTGIPKIGPDFGWALLVGGGLNILASVLYMRAIRGADLSVVVPLVAFTPLFLLLTSPLLLGERPGTAGTAGVVLIVVGSYVLKFDKRAGGPLNPFRSLLKEPGGRPMLLVAFLWSITANVDKMGIRDSSPVFWAVAVNVVIAAALAPWALMRGRMHSFPKWRALLPIGAAGGFGTVCQMVAVSMAYVPYVIALKRTSTVMSVLWGHLLFQEPGLRERLSGAVLMLTGMVLILLF